MKEALQGWGDWLLRTVGVLYVFLAWGLLMTASGGVAPVFEGLRFAGSVVIGLLCMGAGCWFLWMSGQEW